MTKLSVNVNKLATLRNSREKNLPDVVKMTQDIVSFGAEGITVHPRPDGRHIRKQDVYDIVKVIDVEFNIEGYPDKDYLALIKDIKPAQATLVPDPPHVLTSNAGWQIEKNLDFLLKTISELKSYGTRTSIFIDPYKMSSQELECLKLTGTDRVELYTEAYADSYGTPAFENTLKVYKNTADAVNALGIDLNAGHDLNLFNLKDFVNQIPSIKEVSIGHALICDALYYGMKDTIARYLACLNH